MVLCFKTKIKIFQYDKIVTKFNMNNKFYTKKNIDIKPSYKTFDATHTFQYHIVHNDSQMILFSGVFDG